MFKNLFEGLQKNKILIFLGILVIAITITYSNHFHNPFHFDDSHTIENNNAIRSLKNIPDFFMDARTTSSLPANQIYRPGLTTLNAIDYWIGGTSEPQPFYFHLSIFTSYILLGILLYFLFLKIFNETREHKWNTYFALFGAAFYSLHTANAETINYVIARSDSFSTLMIVLSLNIYLYFPQWRNKFIYLIPVLIGFFVKEPTIMVAPLLLIHQVLIDKKISIPEWFSKKGIQNFLSSGLKLIPLFILVVLLFLVSQKMASDTFVPGITSRFDYIITQPLVIVHYVNNFILPIDLSADTDWRAFTSLSDTRVLIGFIFLIALISSAVYCSTKKILLPISFGIIWFLLALLPTSIMPLSEVLNDHRTFFPYIGLAFAVAWLTGLMAIHFQEKIENNLKYKITALALPFVLLTAHATGAHHRNNIWSSGESLWYDVTIKSPNNGRGLMNYGVARMAKGDYKTALDCFDRALKILPGYSYLYVNKAIAEGALGKIKEAEENYKKALQLNVGNPESYCFYAGFLKSQKRYKEALEQARNGLKVSSGHTGNKTMAEELSLIVESEGDLLAVSEQRAKKNPTPENFLTLSLTYYQNLDYEKCILAANEAIKLKTNFIEAYNNICSAQNMLGNYEEGIKAGQQALKINPDYQLAKNNLADGLSRKEKVDQLLSLIKKNPSDANYINLSLLYYNLGTFQKCADAAEQALKANPNSDVACNNICSAYNMLKKWDKAIEAGKKGLKIKPDNQLLKNNLNLSLKGKAEAELK